MKKIFNYFSIFTIIFGTTFGSINSANAGAVNQTATAKTSYVDDDAVTLTATTATTTLSADDTAATFVNTDGQNTAWTIQGGFDLTVSGAITALAEEDTIAITLSGTGTELTLGEAAVETDDTGIITISAGSGTTVEVTGDDTHVWSLDGTEAGVGTLTSTGTSTFADEIGENYALAIINVATGETATFNEEVSATTINSVGTTVFKKAVTATSIILDGTSTLNNTDAVTIAGAFTESATDDTSKLIIKNSANAEAPSVATLTGDVTLDDIEVGATANAGSAKFTGTITGDVTVIGGDADVEDTVAEFTGNVTGAIVLTKAGLGDATFKTSGSTANTITGAITATGDADGILIVSNTGGTTFSAGVGTDDAKLISSTVSASSEAVFTGAVAANTLTITGTATLKAADNESEVFAMGASSILYIDKTIVTTNAVINEVATTRPTLTSGAKIYLPENLSNGQTLTLFYGEADNGLADNATTVTETNAALQDNALIDYVATASTALNGSTVVTASDKAESTTASELGVTANQARSLKQALASVISDTNVDGTAEDAFNNGLNGIGGYSATEDTALARQVAPQDELISGSTFAAKAMTGTVQGIMSSRMASLRSGDAYFGTGVNAAGEMMSANSAFIQIFGSEAEQDNLTKGSGIQYGYDTQTEGIAIGFDGINDNNSVFGISLSRSTTELVGKGTGSAKNDIDSYTVSLYMDKTTDAGYVEGSLTAGINENVTSRVVNTAGLSRTYKGAYDSSQLSLKIGGGVPKSVGGDAFVTPFGSVTGTLINTDDYTETSTTSGDNLRLRIAQDDVNSIVGTVGLKYHNVLSNGGVPMISLALNGELGDKTIDSTNTYQGGGTSFKTSTDVEELSATLGLGYTFNSDRTSVEIAYEADANSEDYLSHYGSFKIVGKF